MLSEAKHLQYLLENKQMQILRCAQNDSVPGFFGILLGPIVRDFVDCPCEAGAATAFQLAKC